MALANGARLGSYEITAALGAGAMGEVYKARDTRLDRVVAIKVLPERFAEDPARRERFEREARAVAALNHPHICQLYDVGSDEASSGTGPQRFLVMEYLEGQSLEDRIVAGPLPIADALRVAIDLADALDHAHRRGLVHRDLKPANVMLTKAGAGPPQAKLLDFGISRLQAPADLPALETVTEDRAPLTADGAVLGTYPYMSPEQLAGREADARSDLFSFGAVLYEMITGQRAFQGTTAATLIGAILHSDPPPLAARQPLAPAALERVVARCLAKDPDNRWQTARDLALELKWVAEHPASSAGTGERRWTSLPAVAIAAVLVALAIGATVSSGAFLRAAPEAAPVVHLPLAPPEGVDADSFSTIGPVRISPDGRRLVYAWAGPDGRQLLWVRSLDSLEARPIADTDGGAHPFWSPDSRWIGFFAQRKLKKVAIDGGPAQILCDARQPRGGTWSVNDVILFSAGAGHEMYHVPAGGGVATLLPADGLNQERNQPSFLPDGSHFVYAGRPQKPGVFIGSLDAPAATLVLDGYSAVAYVPPGYLLLLKGAAPAVTAMTLLAQRFDTATLQVRGDPEALADRIRVDTLQGLGHFSASHTGTLVYTNTVSLTTRLTWFDRRGAPLGPVGSGGTFEQPALSPDGATIATRRIDPETQNSDLWLIAADSGLSTRLTQGEFSFRPVWSPDGTRVLFTSSRRRSPPNLYITSLSGSEEKRLFESQLVNHPTDWSRDGQFIVYSTLNPSNGWDLMLMPMSASETEPTPRPFLSTDFNELFGRVSPDGRWLAYMSDESGSGEIYVQSFPTPGAKQRISAAGGMEPVWRADGAELYYVTPDNTLMAVPVTSGPTFRHQTPVPQFKARFSHRIVRSLQFEPTFAVSNDGKRFLVTTVIEESGTTPTKILFNWVARLGRQ